MPNLKKLFSKFNREEREVIESLIEIIMSLSWHNLDIKKLRGYQNIFRVRKGKIRILFAKNKKDILILAIERRREDTYKF
ncbi:MAG: type II toxin-antitoxin system RelE/ParE family toxin [Parcubacteria group bacterium]|nr:type II toxin-antitoxin system RelE/ParE family toxin [Parcubacteria group bacterium]